jgi:hypothetical protein
VLTFVEVENKVTLNINISLKGRQSTLSMKEN